MAQAATYPVDIIAKLFGLTTRRVQQLSAEHVIPKAERGRYELVPAVQGYIKYLKDRAIGGDIGAGDESEHKRRLLKARADIAEMEAERLAGDLVPTEEVERVWTDIMGRVKTRMQAVAPKASPLTSVDNTTQGNHEIIETFINEGLAELAATPVIGASVLGASGTGDDADGGTTAEADDFGMGGSLSEAVVGSLGGTGAVDHGAG